MFKDEGVPIKGNTEIEQALQEFQIQSNTVQKEQPSTQTLPASEAPGMVRLVIKYSGGLVKNRRQAEYILLGVVVLMLALSLYFFFGAGRDLGTPEDIRILPGYNNNARP